ncbi:MAG: DNA double-strand break repair nuclease NurA, partial [Chloroflexota bacterium]
MTLEFEKLTADLEKMAQTAARRRQRQETQTTIYQQTLNEYATDWSRIEEALRYAAKKADEKFYRSAGPLDDSEPLNTAVSPPPPPELATIIAVDGSQILPDRHAAYQYYLVNVGGIVYHHGQGKQPDIFSIPTLVYPDEDKIDEFDFSSGDVSIERDEAEIQMLAKQSVKHRHLEGPMLSLLDQRLLYWPIGSAGEAENSVVTEWNKHMASMHAADALLAGYIDRPGTSYVTTLLRSLEGLKDDFFDWKSLGKRSATGGITDRDLFSQILGPGQRSRVFVNISPPNQQFSAIDPSHEICFFYLNPTTSDRQIARVDIPRWVADDAEAVTAVHSLIVSQCQIMG